MTRNAAHHLLPVQVCFVVDDVAAAVDECVTRFGWGPFHQFVAPVSNARYHDWRGATSTSVALGMAGPVQVELIHVSEGHNTVAAYQARYGIGFQHLGIRCDDRAEALASLEAIGGALDDQGEYPGIRFAFVDTPTGPGMFELLQPTGETPPPGANEAAVEHPSPVVSIDRATIVTGDLDRALEFYCRAFRWEDVRAEIRTLRVGESETRVRRAREWAGNLLLELVEPRPGGDDPYARHLARGEHGLVHAGGPTARMDWSTDAGIDGQWVEEGEAFRLLDWSGGPRGLQVRKFPA